MAKKKAKRKVASKKVAPKRRAKKSMPAKTKCCHNGDMFLGKLSFAAFILFLITVWPGLHSGIMSVHWGWFLAAFVILGIRPFATHCR